MFEIFPTAPGGLQKGTSPCLQHGSKAPDRVSPAQFLSVKLLISIYIACIIIVRLFPVIRLNRAACIL